MMNITKVDCEKILLKELKHLKFSITDFQVTRFGDFMGFLGDYFRIKIQAQVNGELQNFQYFMKTLPEGKDRELQDYQGFHKKEIAIYKKVFGIISLADQDPWCPKYFLSKGDALVLEDLIEKGYKTLPFSYKFKQTHVEKVLKMLARFHSCSIVYEHKNPKENIGDKYAEVLVDKSFDANNLWLQNGFRAIEKLAMEVESFGSEKGKFFALKSFTKKLDETFERIFNPTKTVDFIKVLAHADLWKNNLMFKFEDEKSVENPIHCVLLDFQLAKYIPLQIDVLIAIIVNTKRDHYEEMMHHYLKFYYESLKQELSKHCVNLDSKITFEKFEKSCEYFKHAALVYNALVTMLIHCPVENYSRMTSEEYETFLIKNRYPMVKALMEENVTYAEEVKESIKALNIYFNDTF